MKKTLIAMLLIVAMLTAACGSAAPAPTEAPAATVEPSQEPSAEPTEIPEAEEPAPMPSYIANQVTVTEINEELIQTTLNVDEQDEMSNTINYMVGEDTLVYDAAGNKLALSDVKVGSLISVYVNAYSPAPMIMPPQYQASIIIVEDPEAEEPGFTCADTFVMTDEMLTGLGNTLALNMNEDVIVVDREDNAIEEPELENKDLLVFYGASTRSIPAQTTPVKVVVLGENEMALAGISAENAQ